MPQPKIIFLGTGGDAFVVGKQILASGGIVVMSGETQLHIDPGPGSLVKAKEYAVDIRLNTAVLVSHAHMNHCNDVNAVIEAMSFAGLDVHGVLVCNSTLFYGYDTTKPVVTDHHRRWVERCLVLEPRQKIGINDIDIHATLTKHSDLKGIGFRICTPDFSLGYSSDTELFDELADEFKDVDILILNVPYPCNAAAHQNLCAADAIQLLRKVKPNLAIITHFGIKMLEADILNQVRDIQKQSKVETIAAKDGMAINPLTYSVNVRRKKF